MYQEEMEYVGFWARVGASLIDSILLMIVILPPLVAIYGWEYFDAEATGLVAGPADFVISWVLPAVAVLGFWLYKQATPGKMAVSARVVDEDTGDTISVGQSVIRYLAYIISTIPLCLGFLWIAFDSKKQGWHDKLAGTVVVRVKKHGEHTTQAGGL